MSFALYLIGFIVFIGGLAYAAHIAGLAPVWIMVGAITLLGIGIFTGVVRTRHKDNAEA